MDAQGRSFDGVKSRLEEIVEAVNAEGVTLDEALALYEEAVKLGLAACDLSEQDALEAAERSEAEAPDGSSEEGPSAVAEAAEATGSDPDTPGVVRDGEEAR